MPNITTPYTHRGFHVFGESTQQQHGQQPSPRAFRRSWPKLWTNQQDDGKFGDAVQAFLQEEAGRLKHIQKVTRKHRDLEEVRGTRWNNGVSLGRCSAHAGFSMSMLGPRETMLFPAFVERLCMVCCLHFLGGPISRAARRRVTAEGERLWPNETWRDQPSHPSEWNATGTDTSQIHWGH